MVSIVIPAYNEEKRILPTLEAYKKELAISHELIVVINGTTDNTEKLVRSFTTNYPEYELKIFIIKEAGKGLAIIEGFKQAKGDIVGFVDADMATPINDVKNMLTTLEDKKVDGVIASRLKPGSVIHDRSAARHIAGRVFASIVRFLTDLEYYDTQCGAKFFTREAIHKMQNRLSAADMTIDVDMLLAAYEQKLNVVEMPTEWFDRSSSAMLGSFKGFVVNSYRMFLNVLKLQKKYHTHD